MWSGLLGRSIDVGWSSWTCCRCGGGLMDVVKIWGVYLDVVEMWGGLVGRSLDVGVFLDVV